MENFNNEIIRIIKRELGFYNTILSVQQNLKEDIGIGSFEKARIIYALEKRFNIISDSDLSVIQTVGDCVKYVEQEMKKKKISS